MINNLASIKAGLALVMLDLLVGIDLGATFGGTRYFETYVTQGIVAHPELDDAKSPERYGALCNERIYTPQE